MVFFFPYMKPKHYTEMLFVHNVGILFSYAQTILLIIIIFFFFALPLISHFSFMYNIFPFDLQGGYPAKLKKVLIVTAPLWFKAPFKILRLFVREKLRDRVYTISLPQVRDFS